MRYGVYAILAAAAPALWYVRRFKRTLDADIAAANSRGGVADPQLRSELLRKLQIGGALCELPLALGALYLMAGGEQRQGRTAEARELFTFIVQNARRSALETEQERVKLAKRGLETGAA